MSDYGSFNRHVLEAEKRVADMDKADGRKDRALTTIMIALAAGLNSPETGAHFDAFVMLRDLVATQKAEGRA